ncbi:uncharacterized protein VNE69_04107 [Vairimorpha necatrix]|uniref:Uncharacterized protein n=1 Tax=Vairimorpha necatrix TaxID=6039 RepID=A0AAX4JBG3_9MICR
MWFKILFFVITITANREFMLFSIKNGDVSTVFIGINNTEEVFGCELYKLFVYNIDSNTSHHRKDSEDFPFQIVVFEKSKYDVELLTYLEKAFPTDIPDKMNFIRCKMFLKARIELKSCKIFFIANVVSSYKSNKKLIYNTDVNYLDNNIHLHYIEFHLNNENYDELKKIMPDHSYIFILINKQDREEVVENDIKMKA